MVGSVGDGRMLLAPNWVKENSSSTIKHTA